MNARFHKEQAEGLLKEANRIRQYSVGEHDRREIEILMQMAQVHATLATIPDEERL